MPLSMNLAWGPVAEHPLLVAHTTGCVICAEFIRHLRGAQSEPSLREAQMSVQAQLQARFWQYFEEHSRSKEGGDAAENERRIAELQEQLKEARQLADERRETMERYRRERNDERERYDDLQDEKDRLQQQLEDMKKQQESRAETARYQPYSRPNEDRTVRRGDRREDMSSRFPPPISAGDVRGFDMFRQGSSTTTRPTQTSPETQRIEPPREEPAPHPMVDYDFSSEDEATFDAKRARRISSRQVMRNARRGVPAPPRPGMMTWTGTTAASHQSLIPNWPHDELAAPANSDPKLTNHWYDFVPMTQEEARQILDASHTDMGQARHRIQHLLAQVNANPALTSVRGLQVLVSSWRNLDRAGPSGGPSNRTGPTVDQPHPAAYTPPGLIPTSTAHLPMPTTRNDRPIAGRPYRSKQQPHVKLAQPRLDSTAKELREWMKNYPSSRPSWMTVAPDGRPQLVHVEFHQMGRRALTRRVTPSERGRWLSLTNVLFSVPGLYRHIILTGQYPVSPESTTQAYPGSFAEDALSLFHVALWYARLGVTIEWADEHRDAAARSRAAREGITPGEPITALPGIHSVSEVVNVPPPQSLNIAATPTSTATNEAPAANPAPPPPAHASNDNMEVEEGEAAPTTTAPVTEMGDAGARQETQGEPGGDAPPPYDDATSMAS
ncbi:hypothetical protein C2E23DRAFT_891311 [Lenzites betulinus]|nr:hypothetical protein C2E23DRAFT_891311 [Lenzites betulinus]